MSANIYSLKNKFEFIDQNFAHTIISNDFPVAYGHLIDFCTNFELYKSEILAAGGNETNIPKKVKKYFIDNGWDQERKFEVSTTVDGVKQDSSSYKIDLYHEEYKIAFDIEWNSKDSVFNRDLSNFRILHEKNAINLAIIFTRTHGDIMEIAKTLGIGKKYGASTTNFKKLHEKLELGILGKCPLLAIGIGKGCYNPNK